MSMKHAFAVRWRDSGYRIGLCLSRIVWRRGETSAVVAMVAVVVVVPKRLSLSLAETSTSQVRCARPEEARSRPISPTFAVPRSKPSPPASHRKIHVACLHLGTRKQLAQSSAVQHSGIFVKFPCSSFLAAAAAFQQPQIHTHVDVLMQEDTTSRMSKMRSMSIQKLEDHREKVVQAIGASGSIGGSIGASGHQVWKQPLHCVLYEWAPGCPWS